jgi:site-specific DNA-methyltransferase (adenine-specific)
MSEVIVMQGDCLDVLAQLADCVFDSLVTDPPSGKNFMGLDWDSSMGDPIAWSEWLAKRLRECLRVLKPGAHGLVWSHSSTSWMTGLALHLAGFEIIDTVAHLNGQGWPKNGCRSVGLKIDRYLGVESVEAGDNPNHRPISGVNYEGVYAGGNTGAAKIKRPASDEGKKWEGYNSFLKGAREDWFLVRKPLEGTVAANIMKWGVGALNIDGCRIATDETLTRKLGKTTTSESGWKSVNRSEIAGSEDGRYPANVVLSHHDDCVECGAVALRPSSSSTTGNEPSRSTHYVFGQFPPRKAWTPYNDVKIRYACVPECPVRQLDDQGGHSRSRRGRPRKSKKPGDGYGMTHTGAEYDDAGGPSRFFFVAKPTRKEKGEASAHQTVKPIELMRYLTRMVTPSGGAVLDPFFGTGTTGIACREEGFDCLGVELKEKWAEVAERRNVLGEVATCLT